jgi:O-antigen ligase
MGFFLTFTEFMQPGIVWPQLAAFKPVMSVLIVALLVALVLPDFADRFSGLRQPLVGYTFAFVLVQTVSVFRGGILTMVDMFMAWLPQLGLVCFAICLTRSVRDIYSYVWGMLVGGMYVVLYGLGAYFYELPGGTAGVASAYGVYSNHNDYTYLIVFVLPFLFFFRRVSGNPVLRVVLLACLVACVAGVLLSLSRWGVLTLVIEMALLAVYTDVGVRKVLYLVLVGYLGVQAVDAQWQRRAAASKNYTIVEAESSRVELWKAAQNAFLAHPLLGVGCNRFREVSEQYGEISHDNRGKNTHNTFLEVLANSGALGMTTYVLLILALVRALRVGQRDLLDPRLDALRRASLVCLYSFLFRGLTNAKPHEFGFFAVVGIAGAYLVLRQRAEDEAEEEEDDVEDESEEAVEEAWAR